VRTQELLEFYMYAPFKSHDNATMSYIADALRRIHTFKDVFLLGQAGKQACCTVSGVLCPLLT
jgi:hypothetical protein